MEHSDFLKGLARVLLGQNGQSVMYIFSLTYACSAVTKPVVGVFDLASNVAEGYSQALLSLLILKIFRNSQYNYRFR
jgi:hypothetical protein